MSEYIAEIAKRLAERVEAVCRHYLPAGRRERHQWRVGDVNNQPGRSLFVRLVGPTSGRAAAGRWRDAATGEHGDLIDLIRQACLLSTTAEALTEARRFLSLPTKMRRRRSSCGTDPFNRYDPMTSVKRLIAESRPIDGTLAQAYLRHRGINPCADLKALRFHPRCPYRNPDTGRFSCWPALLALVTDLNGNLTGLQRTYLSPKGDGKANLPTPRRSLGATRGHGVRFGVIDDVALIGEGVETVLSLKCVFPTMPMVAALSADNLGASAMPPTLRRLYVAIDRDPAGFAGTDSLHDRLRHAGVDVVRLLPAGEDFNADLVTMDQHAVRRRVTEQLLAADLERLQAGDGEFAIGARSQATFDECAR